MPRDPLADLCAQDEPARWTTGHTGPVAEAPSRRSTPTSDTDERWRRGLELVARVRGTRALVLAGVVSRLQVAIFFLSVGGGASRPASSP
jgi:hypothetical protein